ncbi:NigD-like protein [Xylanibacter caecicola]|uniref:NigD-like protein n=1 Tax=Xylanibacter caecicola TaxID=2736294 RepID=UPI0025855911|nr:NigD-like protein [Xylanibacter caecicola]
MKGLKTLAVILTAVFGMTALQSCDNDDEYIYTGAYPNAMVTVKKTADGGVYLQLDDKTTLLPVNMKKSPYYLDEVRAFASLRYTNDDSNGYTKAAYVHYLDSVLTKFTAPDLGTDNDKTYGNDPIDIVRDWTTVVEDGFITMRIRAPWSNGSKPHYINLLRGTDSANPYEVELRHDARGDVYGPSRDAVVAFNLKDLPDTGGKTVKLKVKWKSPAGMKTHEFDYRSRGTQPEE